MYYYGLRWIKHLQITISQVHTIMLYDITMWKGGVGKWDKGYLLVPKVDRLSNR